eukprot:9283382-Pyramimonas_sp.AAC.2
MLWSQAALSHPRDEELPQKAYWLMDRSHFAHSLCRMRGQILASIGAGPMGRWPLSGFGIKTMMVVQSSPRCGLRSHELSKLASLNRISSPTSSASRGWKLPHPKPVVLGNLRATSLISSIVMGLSVQSP